MILGRRRESPGGDKGLVMIGLIWDIRKVVCKDRGWELKADRTVTDDSLSLKKGPHTGRTVS